MKNREIKFRAWKRNKMYNNIGLHPHICMDHTKQDEDEVTFVNIKTTNDGHLTLWNTDDCIMQFTGLKDKNGVDIYEGDIVNDWQGTRAVKFEIYDNQQGYDIQTDDTDLEVIGNLYEHPNLLTP